MANWKSLGPRDGLIIGSTTGKVPLWEPDYLKYCKNSAKGKSKKYYPQVSLLDDYASHFNFRGFKLILSSACTASTQALGLAYRLLKSKKLDRCLIGGHEVLSELTCRGFESLGLISSNRSRPFDSKRDGINLSEGNAFLCLERFSNQLESNPIGEIKAYHCSTDAYHMTSPHPEGLSLLASIRYAMKEAKLREEDISWIHAHGTGSIHNDLAEGKAFYHFFQKNTIVTSTKGYHGHTLGASGAIEVIISLMALNENVILPTLGLIDPDPEIPLSFLPEASSIMDGRVKNILKTTSGFGGCNAALVLSGV